MTSAACSLSRRADPRAHPSGYEPIERSIAVNASSMTTAASPSPSARDRRRADRPTDARRPRPRPLGRPDRRVGRRRPAESRARPTGCWWDADADDYQAEHGDFLGDVDFVWCPEGLREADARLLGAGGRTPGAGGRLRRGAVRALAGDAGRARRSALDLSARHAAARGRAGGRRTGVDGAAGAGRRRAAAVRRRRVRPGLLGVRRGPVRGRLGPGDARGRPGAAAGRALGVRHDPPDALDLPRRPRPGRADRATPYFDRTPYVEVDDAGRPTYVEHHRTLGDRVREIVGAGFAAGRPRRAGVAGRAHRRSGASGARCAARSSRARRSTSRQAGLGHDRSPRPGARAGARSAARMMINPARMRISPSTRASSGSHSVTRLILLMLSLASLAW